MARTRKTSREALDEKIEKAEEDVIAAKKRYDHATAVLKELLDKGIKIMCGIVGFTGAQQATL